jgi:NIMA (never in mitosis gene a)-related kinase
MHRDIKSANILISKGAAKLADFNVSKVVGHQGMLRTQTGTPYYASPEVWMDKPYDFKSDIWSLGCVLYEMATLRPPFKAPNMRGLYKKVITAQYPPLSSRYSPELQQTIECMLRTDPAKRPTCEQLITLKSTQLRISQLSKSDQHVNNAVSDFYRADSNGLLESIRLPKMMQLVQLPKPNYRPRQTRMLSMEQIILTDSKFNTPQFYSTKAIGLSENQDPMRPNSSKMMRLNSERAQDNSCDVLEGLVKMTPSEEIR